MGMSETADTREMDDANTYLNAKGVKVCRACKAAGKRRPGASLG
jgi:hypothetical protein